MEYSVSLMCVCPRSIFLTDYAENLFGNEYRKKVGDFKTELDRAKESFDRSIALEKFKAIHGIGTFQL
jgi:hypothetical protein